ncbi:MAG: carboxylesterase family protein [Acidobacteriaceae bacterium]
MLACTRREFVGKAAAAAFLLRARGGWAQTPGVVVRTPDGTLRGEMADGVKVFKGVPFAEPPVGDLRFRAPIKVKPWTGERDATQFAPMAMQSGTDEAMSEDCLYLNVWAPVGAGPFPVLVWVHGGGNTGGASHSAVVDGATFARAGIVCVTVAYRLGVFGFLDVESLLGRAYAGSANHGMKDVVAALRWVQEAIGAFGGDATRVTIGGQSAGAKIVDMMLGVPEARGLFHAVISESGGAERVASGDTARETAQGFAKVWARGAETIKTAPAKDLIAAQETFLKQWPQHYPLRPEVDGQFLPKLPIEMIAAGGAKGKRLLIGTNLDESASFLGPHPARDVNAADLGMLPLDRFERVYARYRPLYPDLPEDRLRIRAVTAEEYWVRSVRAADAFVAGGGTAWMYRMDFVPSSGPLQGLASHGEEMPMVWDRPRTRMENRAAEAALGAQVHAAWVAFLHGDAPHADGLPQWTVYGRDERATMVFNSTCRIEKRPMETELHLWDGVL